MSTRLLIVGIEATDTCLIERHMDEGRLPIISALRAHGRLKKLHVGGTDAALWASFHYAAAIGEHGRYHDYVRLANGRFGLAVEEEQRETIWDELSRDGLRVAVFDLPKSRAPRPINGIHLADWLVHGRLFPRPLSYPMKLAAEVVGRFGEAPPSRCGRLCSELDDAQTLESLGNLQKSVSMKRAAALSYLEREHWDCFLVNFKEMHCCSHGFWHLIDPTHPAHDAAKALRLGDPSATILQDIDRAVGDLVAAAGPHSEVILFSTSDFQPNGSAHHLLPQIVVQLNKYLWSHGTGSHAPHSNWGVRMLPYGEHACALRIAGESRASTDDAVLDETRAITMDAVESLLRNIMNSETGEPIFEWCDRPSSRCVGEKARSLPDLLLFARVRSFPRSVVSPELGVITSDVPRWRPGNHREGGFVIARGAAAEAALGAVESLEQLARVPRGVLDSPCN